MHRLWQGASLKFQRSALRNVESRFAICEVRKFFIHSAKPGHLAVLHFTCIHMHSSRDKDGRFSCYMFMNIHSDTRLRFIPSTTIRKNSLLHLSYSVLFVGRSQRIQSSNIHSTDSFSGSIATDILIIAGHKSEATFSSMERSKPPPRYKSGKRDRTKKAEQHRRPSTVF